MRLLGRSPRAPALPPAPRANGSLGTITWPADPLLRVSRESAMSLSVVANARNVIVGIASQLSVDRIRGEEVLEPGTILTQPDIDEVWPATIGRTVDHLIFYGSADWLVLNRDSEGYPSRARLLPYGAAVPDISDDWARLSRVTRADPRLVDPAGAHAFAAAMPAGYCTVRDFAGYYHEVFNEREPERVGPTRGRSWRSRARSKSGSRRPKRKSKPPSVCATACSTTRWVPSRRRRCARRAVTPTGSTISRITSWSSISSAPAPTGRAWSAATGCCANR